MRLFLRVLMLSCFSAVAGCNTARQPEELRPTATVKDIMDSIVDPSADVLWESVATIVTAEGTEERAPKTDEEWTNVRRHAVQLVEASNLLLIKGRHVARPGERSENAKIELEPEEIESLIDKDWNTWTRLALALHDATMPAFDAIQAKNAQGLWDAGEGIDTACENCHLKYWYPNSGPPLGSVPLPRTINGAEGGRR